jgi:hypothetical protein
MGRGFFVDLTETAAVVYRSIVALGSLAVPARLRFGPNEGIPHIIGTGFVVDPRGIVMTAGHVARALSLLPRHPETDKHSAMTILFGEPTRVGDALEMKPLWSFVPSVVVVNEVEGVIDRGDGRPDLLAARSGYRLHLQRHLAIPVTDTCVAQVVGKP